MNRLALSFLIGLCMVAPLAAQTPVADQDINAAVMPAARPPTQLLVMLQPGADSNAFAQDHGVKSIYQLRSDADAFVFDAITAENAARLLPKMQADVRVRAAYFNEHTQYVLFAFVPNDTYFHKDTPSSGWKGQWHLINEHVAGRDARVQGAWNNDITGSGVTIGIVDDCFQTTHPDLSTNYVAADSWDFGQNDGVPDPVNSSDQHGISVAGVAAARGGNGFGVTGAAPFANLAGLRVDFVNQTTAQFVDATQYHSWDTNTNIGVKNHSYGYTSPYISTTAELAAAETSAAAGTVHCYSAGNNRGASAQDSNKMMVQNSPSVICVAAMNANGTYANYSNFGACVFCTAPSDGTSSFGITTTDKLGTSGYNGAFDSFPDTDYTSTFGGTSSASPLVAGVMALLKQTLPNLNVRLAKHLLVRTCDVIDASNNNSTSDGGWKTNAAGFTFNQNYGFGLIDAAGLTQLAATCAAVTPLTTASSGNIMVSAAIPDNNTSGVVQNFMLNPANPQPLEEVQVTLSITHSNRGEIEAYLTSPSGTTSRLMIRQTNDGPSNINWTFTTNAFWGETASGNWSLRVVDTVTNTTGTWNSFNTTIRMGNLICDVVPPVVQNVTPVTPNGAYKAGANIDIRVTFSEPVILTTGPRLRVNVGGPLRFAEQLSGSGTDQIVFRYVVQAGDNTSDLDYNATTALALNGGTIKDAAGNDADRTLAAPGDPGSLGANANIIIDTTAPTVDITTPSSGSSFTTNMTPFDLSGTASDNESVSSVSWARVGGGSGSATGTTNWTVTGVNLQSGNNTLIINAVDPAGNTGTDQLIVNYDNVPPGVSIGAPSLSSICAGAGSVDYTITYTDASSVTLAPGDVTLNSTGGASAMIGVSGSGTATRTVTLSSITGSGTVGITIAANTAVDSAGNFALAAGPSATFAVNAAPGAPTGVSASVALCDKVQVSWTASGGATGYTVWRNTVDDSGTATQIGSPSASPYDDSTAIAGTAYFYWVTATNTCGSSDFSTSDDGQRAGPPDAPASVSASDGSHCDKIVVSWNAVAGATGYTVWRHTIDDSGAATQVGSPAASPFDDSTASPGTTYYYWVKAVNTCGASDFSLADTGLRAAPPAAPNTASASSGTDCDKVVVTWDSALDAVDYTVWRNTLDDSGSSVPVGTTAALTLDDTSAAPGTTYFYWVTANNSCGSSGFTPANTGHRAASPAAPASASATDDAHCDKVVVTWSSVAGATDYSIWRHTADDSGAAVQIGTTAALTFDDTIAAPGTTYYYWIMADNACGSSGFSLSDNGSRAAAPAAPTAPAASDGTPCDKVVVTWSSVAGATDYSIWRHTADDSGSALQIGTTAALTFDDTTAAPDTTYYYWIIADNACGSSGFSPSNSGSRSAASAAPTSVTATDGNHCEKVLVTWASAAGSVDYSVWRHTADDSGGAVQIGTTAGLTFDDTTAAPVTTYYYWVRSNNVCGASGFSTSDSGSRAASPLGAGDVNVDTLVDGGDIHAFVTCLLNNSTSGNCSRADMNCDGVVNAADATILVNMLLGP